MLLRSVEQFHQPHRQQSQHQRTAGAERGVPPVKRAPRLLRGRGRLQQLGRRHARSLGRLELRPALHRIAVCGLDLAEFILLRLVFVEARGELPHFLPAHRDLTLDARHGSARWQVLPALRQARLLARFALDLDLPFKLREACPLRDGLRFLCQVFRRVAALEIPQFLAHLRGALLEVGERRIVPCSNHCLAGSSRLGEGTQLAFGNGDCAPARN